jgi:peptidase M48-like protein/PDZ domain-containing protein
LLRPDRGGVTRRFILAAAFLALLQPAAAAGQAVPGPGAGSTLRQADLRVAAAAYRIALAGQPLCSDPFPLTGLLFHHLAEYEPADRALVTERYGLDRGPGILTVLAGSPAARAGLAAGDVLLAVNGARFESPVAIAAERERDKWRKRVEASELQLEDQLRRGPASLRVLRGGAEIGLTLDSVSGCQGRVRLARSSQVNAFANGRYVVVTTAMLDFLRSDDELAVVLAHELSHNILRHPALLDEQGVPKRGLLRGIGKNAKRVWRTEAEADRFGIRLMAAAGYDVGAAIPFWRRYLGKYDVLPQIFRTHPSLSARERITREAIEALNRPAPPQP